MRVAFATRDGEHVNEQLRRAPQLMVFEVTAAGHRLERTCPFEPGGRYGTDERIRAIAGCSIVYVSAIGPSSAARLATRGIRAATAPEGTRIQELLAALRRLLTSADRLDPESVAPGGKLSGHG
jgi:nitrogen fixation protein NifX